MRLFPALSQSSFIEGPCHSSFLFIFFSQFLSNPCLQSSYHIPILQFPPLVPFFGIYSESGNLSLSSPIECIKNNFSRGLRFQLVRATLPEYISQRLSLNQKRYNSVSSPGYFPHFLHRTPFQSLYPVFPRGLPSVFSSKSSSMTIQFVHLIKTFL